jgi:hypothetical protein
VAEAGARARQEGRGTEGARAGFAQLAMLGASTGGTAQHVGEDYSEGLRVGGDSSSWQAVGDDDDAF